MIKDELNAYITIIDEDSTGDSLRMAIKDNICTKGIRTTAGSRILKDFIPPYSATVVDRILDAGAVIVGKTNMDEFAMGSTTETSYFGAVHNPYDITRTAGGSSGGSAAAVATGTADAALGSDTGGSIRQPCAYCGVTGIKPTYGTVSRYGLIAYASSFDQIGPIAKDIKTCAKILDIIKGRDEKDSTTVDIGDRRYITAADTEEANLSGLKIAVPRELITGDIDSDIVDAVNKTRKIFTELGAVVDELSLGLVEYAVPAYYVIACAQASSNLARYDGVRYGYRASEYDDLSDMYDRTYEEGFGKEVKRRIELGRYVLSEGYIDEYYMQALKVRRLIYEEYKKIYDSYDMILMPVTPTVAPKLGAYDDDRIRMYESDIYTVAANLCGFPAISFPCGYSSIKQDNNTKMPIGLQVMGNLYTEDKLIRAVRAYEIYGG